MDELQSLKETDLSRYCIPLTGVQIEFLLFLLNSIIDGVLIVDNAKFARGYEVPPRSYFRMTAWSLFEFLSHYV